MSMQSPGAKAAVQKGWLAAHKWLILRRLSQTLFIGVFLLGPLSGFWLVKGTLASSMTLDTLPLSDPLIYAQSLLAGHVMETTALVGMLIVAAFYIIVGGRVYCSWVCPVNIVSDTASWLRNRLGWKKTGIKLPRNTALGVLAGVFLVSALLGVIAWEFVNPVTMLHRSIVFGAFGSVALVVCILF